MNVWMSLIVNRADIGYSFKLVFLSSAYAFVYLAVQ